MSSEEQVVVESPTKYEAPVGSLDISPVADGMTKTQQSAGGFHL